MPLEQPLNHKRIPHENRHGGHLAGEAFCVLCSSYATSDRGGHKDEPGEPRGGDNKAHQCEHPVLRGVAGGDPRRGAEVPCRERRMIHHHHVTVDEHAGEKEEPLGEV